MTEFADLENHIKKLNYLMDKHCPYGFLSDFQGVMKVIETTKFSEIMFRMETANVCKDILNNIESYTIIFNKDEENSFLESFNFIIDYLDSIIVMETLSNVAE